MNSSALVHILGEKFPELLTDEEKEDISYIPDSGAIPDMPVNFLEWLRAFRPAPEAMERKEFEARPPAMGLTNALLDELLQHFNHTKISSVQKRKLFDCL